MIFKVGNTDLASMVSGLKVNYEVLVSDESGRNANGDTVVDIVNRKTKLNVTFRHTTQTEMQKILNSIEPFVVNVTFKNPKTNTASTIKAYVNTPSPEYLTDSDRTIYKPLQVNFIQL